MVAIGGSLFVTVRIALLLVALPKVLVTTARKLAPSSESVAPFNVKLQAVAPGMSTPCRCHWNCRGAVPEAATVNVAEPPTGTVRFCGWLVIEGAWLAVKRTRKTAPASRAR